MLVYDEHYQNKNKYDSFGNSEYSNLNLINDLNRYTPSIGTNGQCCVCTQPSNKEINHFAKSEKNQEKETLTNQINKTRLQNKTRKKKKKK